MMSLALASATAADMLGYSVGTVKTLLPTGLTFSMAKLLLLGMLLLLLVGLMVFEAVCWLTWFFVTAHTDKMEETAIMQSITARVRLRMSSNLQSIATFSVKDFSSKVL